MAWLNDNPPVRSQFRHPRRQAITAIVVHTSEQPADLVGEDTGTIALAKYIQRRPGPGSYHWICDSDSSLQLIDDDDEAYGAKYGWNQFALHISHSIRASTWDQLPPRFTDGVLKNSARVVAGWCQAYGISPWKEDAADMEDGLTGICGHKDIEDIHDPGRRSDPGWDEAQWDHWLGLVRSFMSIHVLDIVDEAVAEGVSGARIPFWSIFSDGKVVVNNGAREPLHDISRLNLAAPITGAQYRHRDGGLVLFAAGDGGTFRLGP